MDSMYDTSYCPHSESWTQSAISMTRKLRIGHGRPCSPVDRRVQIILLHEFLKIKNYNVKHWRGVEINLEPMFSVWNQFQMSRVTCHLVTEITFLPSFLCRHYNTLRRHGDIDRSTVPGETRKMRGFFLPRSFNLMSVNIYWPQGMTHYHSVSENIVNEREKGVGNGWRIDGWHMMVR